MDDTSISQVKVTYSGRRPEVDPDNPLHRVLVGLLGMVLLSGAVFCFLYGVVNFRPGRRVCYVWGCDEPARTVAQRRYSFGGSVETIRFHLCGGDHLMFALPTEVSGSAKDRYGIATTTVLCPLAAVVGLFLLAFGVMAVRFALDKSRRRSSPDSPDDRE